MSRSIAIVPYALPKLVDAATNKTEEVRFDDVDDVVCKVFSDKKIYDTVRDRVTTVKRDIDPENTFSPRLLETYESLFEHVQKKYLKTTSEEEDTEQNAAVKGLKPESVVYVIALECAGKAFRNNMEEIGDKYDLRELMRALRPVIHSMRAYYDKGYIHNDNHFNNMCFRVSKDGELRIMLIDLEDAVRPAKDKLKDVWVFLDQFLRKIYPRFSKSLPAEDAENIRKELRDTLDRVRKQKLTDMDTLENFLAQWDRLAEVQV